VGERAEREVGDGDRHHGVVTITNTSAARSRAFTAPLGSTVAEPPTVRPTAALFRPGRRLPQGTLVVDEKVAPTITSANAATSIVGTPFTSRFTRPALRRPRSHSRAACRPASLLDNGNGTATISGTAALARWHVAITITAVERRTTTQSFTLTNAQLPPSPVRRPRSSTRALPVRTQ